MEALIIGDVQVGIVGFIPAAEGVLPPLAAAVAAARAKGVPVIYVRVALRADRAEVPARNPVATWMFEQGDLLQESSPQTAVHPAIAPQPGEPVLTKRRGSAFHGTDLDGILRARGITGVTLAGIATSGVVLATVIDAVERDYAITVLRDGCVDAETDVHEFLLDRIFPGRGARVVTAEQWIDGLG
ncbi:cysteine hydrolase family protein [Labedaea rhizosphaerae]|uniref:Nicotinamidase-related amidase n=1 Tax=Labedaea rhizosphaerae TaxID=598644 RepID=A0A4R6S7M0_LABRH|nr:cysteine hydrolase [Labedaea rhizosphaerae]TDP94805.1 nicotinamidase-related amidase [Labedaea rhizosphaerae]